MMLFSGIFLNVWVKVYPPNDYIGFGSQFFLIHSDSPPNFFSLEIELKRDFVRFPESRA